MPRMEASVDEALQQQQQQQQQQQPHEPQQEEQHPAQEDSLASTAPSEVIAVPTECDILCGKEKECLRHTGSRRFREVVEMHQPEYHLATTKKEKMAITYRVYRLLAESNARFLKFSKQVNGWQAIPHTAVRDKISHALRCIRPKKNKKSKSTTTTSISPGLLLTTTSSSTPRKDNKKKRQSSKNDVAHDDPAAAAAATTTTASKKRRQLSLTQGCRTTKSWPLIAPAVTPTTADHLPDFLVSSVNSPPLPPQGVLLYEDDDEDNSSKKNNVAGSDGAGGTQDQVSMATPTITQEPPDTQVDSKLQLPPCYLPSFLGEQEDDYDDLGGPSDSQEVAVAQQALLKEGGQHYPPFYYDAEKTVHLDMLPPMMVAGGGLSNGLPCLEDTTSEQTDYVMESVQSTSLSSEDASCPPDFLESISQDKIPDCMSITHPTNAQDEEHQDECDFPLEPFLSSELSNYRATIKNETTTTATTTAIQERKEGLIKEIYKSMVNNDDFRPVCNCSSSTKCWFNSCCWMLNYSSAS